MVSRSRQHYDYLCISQFLIIRYSPWPCSQKHAQESHSCGRRKRRELVDNKIRYTWELEYSKAQLGKRNEQLGSNLGLKDVKLNNNSRMINSQKLELWKHEARTLALTFDQSFPPLTNSLNFTFIRYIQWRFSFHLVSHLKVKELSSTPTAESTFVIDLNMQQRPRRPVVGSSTTEMKNSGSAFWPPYSHRPSTVAPTIWSESLGSVQNQRIESAQYLDDMPRCVYLWEDTTATKSCFGVMMDQGVVGATENKSTTLTNRR